MDIQVHICEWISGGIDDLATQQILDMAPYAYGLQIHLPNRRKNAIENVLPLDNDGTFFDGEIWSKQSRQGMINLIIIL